MGNLLAQDCAGNKSLCGPPMLKGEKSRRLGSRIQDVTSQPDMSRRIIVIQTPRTAKKFMQVAALMNDEELADAIQECPDLIFQVAEEPPSTGELLLEQEKPWISLRRMMTPGN